VDNINLFNVFVLMLHPINFIALFLFSHSSENGNPDAVPRFDRGNYKNTGFLLEFTPARIKQGQE